MKFMPDDFPKLRRPSISPLTLGIFVLIAVIAGGAAVGRFMASEREREVLLWQNKLSLIADSRAADVAGWVEKNFKELGAVAGNPSLQLYMTELMNAPDIRIAEEPAQAVFLRNLLSMTADRLGFTAPVSKELQSIEASVTPAAGVGVAIVDANGKFVASTAGLPSFDDALARKVAEATADAPNLIDIFTSEGAKARIGFALPIFAIQADGAAKPIGRLVAVKAVGDDLFGLLKHPGAAEKTLSAVLLRKEGANVAYLSPQEGEADASPMLSLDTPDLDAAFAVEEPGTFAVKRNADSKPTLMTSRAIAGTSWVMLLHVDRDQAMRDSDAHLRQVQYSLLLGLLAAVGGIVAVWYYGTSRRALLLSFETQRMAARMAAQEKLLRVVSDSQTDSIVIVDRSSVARFANAKAARAFRLMASDVAGKTLGALMGDARAKDYEEANRKALEQQKEQTRSWSAGSGPGARYVLSEHIPLAHVPVEGLEVPTPGVLMVDRDVTEVVTERERRMRVLRQLIDMLVAMVDRRDPYAASHSMCVAFVARAVAFGMGLDREKVDTAEIAGKLMNVGKIVVPSEVLTKPAALTDDEARQIQESLQNSVKLLEKIDFDGPVADTLRQAQERYDGAGPLQLKGEDILITARVIAVANAFVAMVSKRAYRQALGQDQALKNLLGQIGAQFDRRVVVALADYIENRKGREEIAKLIPMDRG